MDPQVWNDPVDDPADEEEGGPVLPRRPVRDTADMDITPMIDITFLLLIFFLVASVPDATTAVQLPPARHGKAVNPRTSVILTVAESGGAGPALVYLGDGKVGTPLSGDRAAQHEQIKKAVEKSYRSTVLIKAEKGVKHREVSRVAAAAAAAEVDGMQLHLAVLEVQ